MASGEATHLRSMQAGFSGQGAVLAALLAQRGIVGSREVLEGRYGFYSTYVRGTPDWEVLRNPNVEPFGVLAHHGFKVWPGCAYTRPVNAAVARLRDRHGIRAELVKSMTIIGGSATTALLCEPLATKRRPQAVVDAEYSIPFTAAVMLARGNVTLRDYFGKQALSDPTILDISDRISYRPSSTDTNPAGTGSDFSRPIVEAVLHDGRVVREVASGGVPGDAKNRVGWPELESKFRDCAMFALRPRSASEIDRTIECVRTLDSQKDAAALLRLVA